MITIKEISRQLGLSTTTVSNVIHGKIKEVSPETIEKVRRFLDEVEYVPNISARNLAQNQSKIIGLVLKTREDRYMDLLMDPFVSEMLVGIEKEVRKAGYYMMLYMSDDIAEIIGHASTWNVDGLILYCMLDDDGVRVSEKVHRPIVCIDTYSKTDAPGFVNIGLDDENGAYEAVKYLIGRGHRKIAFLSDNKEGVDLQRFRGYRRALKEAGIEYSDRSFLMLRTEKDEVERSMDRICTRIGRHTAVFCASDLFAVMLMSKLHDNGIRVPEDVSVMGFDDNLYGRVYRPALTSVHQDPEQKGKLAAQVLIGMLQGKEPPSRQITLDTRIVERESVKNL